MSSVLKKIFEWFDKHPKILGGFMIIIWTSSGFSAFKSLSNDGSKIEVSYWFLIFITNTLAILLNFLVDKVKNTKLEVKKQQTQNKSPKNLLYIAALFLPSDIREEVLGHREEVYKKDVKRFGVKKAKWLLAKDIFVSNYPILKEFVRKSVIKIMKLAGLYEVVRRIIG